MCLRHHCAALAPHVTVLALALLPLAAPTATARAAPAANSWPPPSSFPVGPSQTTLACQTAVAKDYRRNTNAALDAPATFDPQIPLSDTRWGGAFAGVSLYRLKNVTQPWRCYDGICLDGTEGDRGEALLWVPDGVTAGAPHRLLYIHGGSWYYGSPTTDGYAPLGAKLARVTGMPVLVIDYPLVPIADWTGIMASIGTAAGYLARPDAVPGGSGSPKIFVAGDSSGGGSSLSAMVSAASQSGLPGAPQGFAFAGGALLSPWIDLTCGLPTYGSQAGGTHSGGTPRRLNGDVAFGLPPSSNLLKVRSANVKNAFEYVGNNMSMLQDPLANPLYADPPTLAKLPPVAIHTGIAEMLQGEAAVFAQKAAKAGALVELHLYDGMFHVFPMYSNGCGAKTGRLVLADSAINSVAAFLRAVAAGGGSGGAPGLRPCTFLHYEWPPNNDSAANETCV